MQIVTPSFKLVTFKRARARFRITSLYVAVPPFSPNYSFNYSSYRRKHSRKVEKFLTFGLLKLCIGAIKWTPFRPKLDVINYVIILRIHFRIILSEIIQDRAISRKLYVSNRVISRFVPIDITLQAVLCVCVFLKIYFMTITSSVFPRLYFTLLYSFFASRFSFAGIHCADVYWATC